MALIEIRGVSKTYRSGEEVETPALHHVDLSIEAKDFVVLAGPSGSGKSTLLHLLGGLDRPTQGEVIISDKKIHQMKPAELSRFRREQVGFVFQAYNLINTLTALENVEYPLLLQRIPVQERQRKAKQILFQVGLKDFFHRFPQQMSGGQQQRVAVARAVATFPKLILADEPSANLDSKNALELLRLMQSLNQERAITFVLATHDPLLINQAKRVVTLKDGKIAA